MTSARSDPFYDMTFARSSVVQNMTLGKSDQIGLQSVVVIRTGLIYNIKTRSYPAKKYQDSFNLQRDHYLARFFLLHVEGRPGLVCDMTNTTNTTRHSDARPNSVVQYVTVA